MTAVVPSDFAQILWIKLQENNPTYDEDNNLIVKLLSLEAGFNDDGSVDFQDNIVIELRNLSSINVSQNQQVSIWDETVPEWENFVLAIKEASGLLVGRAKIQILLNVDIGSSNITEIDKIYTINYNSSFMMGDVNGDGAMNVIDIVELANAVLNDDYSEINFEASDVTGDGTISVLDVVDLANHILDDQPYGEEDE